MTAMHAPRGREAGFTLTEVLVAVMIFAMISAISLAMLTAALRSEQTYETQLDRIAQVQRARTLLRDDVGQLVLRAYRGEEGVSEGRALAGNVEGADPFEPARAGEEREILVLTRRGWANPGGAAPRSSLQRVAWLYDGTTLKRQAWTYPDTARGSEPVTLTVIEEAADLSLEFLVGTAWRPDILAVTDGETRPAMPRAVRVRYTLPGLGEIEHVVLTPVPELVP
ncbi:type II secretion system minor pseudopilin GspJ [Marinicauda sp. Alg238-R41]|uniref:type II secretion system minor pseudopilin GspJ n=1 Tax=Marinicauda sp. Alg238-R41 TaxID=2993447 RepID=UPI0022E22CCD|nr:type II secretion system minor pseudopilin GspJ [Marinicauda sp. Alg238-R41]